MKAGQGRPVGREVDLSLLHSCSQQRKRPEQPARAGILRELAEKGLSVDHSLDQRFELRGLEVEEPFLLEEG